MSGAMEFFGVTQAQLLTLTGEALGRGGDYADIFFEYATLQEMLLKDGRVATVGSTVDYGVGIRVIKGEQTGYAYAESTDMAQMMEAARSAAAIADGFAQNFTVQNITKVKVGSFYTGEDCWKGVAPDYRISFLNSLENMARQRDERVVKVVARIATSYGRSLFFNSLGEMAEDAGPLASVVLQVVMQEGSSVENASSSRSYRVGPEMLTADLARQMVDEAVERCSVMFRARPFAGGQMPVVMAAGGSGILLHEAIGHAFEADFNMKGTSVFSDRMGKMVAPKGVNVVDDGTIPGCRGSVNVDDEGVPGQKTWLVRDGVLNSYLHDRLSARHYGVAPTGNGRRESFRYYPIPRMRTTYMEPGNASEEEIIAEVKDGLYVDDFANGQVQIGAGDFTFYVRSGRLIENGRLTTPVKDINIIGNGPQALADIVAVGSDLQISNGTWTCGKGQYCAVSCGMPTVLVRRLNCGGLV